MRKTVLVTATMAIALLLGTGVALAAAVSGTQGNDTLRGTRFADQIYGLNGNDTLFGAAGSDELYGGAGNDNVYGNSGADDLYGGSGSDNLYGGPNGDFIDSADRGTSDFVDCGTPDGIRDRIVIDENDRTMNCSNTEDTITVVMP